MHVYPEVSMHVLMCWILWRNSHNPTQHPPSCMVAWAELDSCNDRLNRLLNRHFSNSIFNSFFTGHLRGKRAKRKMKYFYFYFWGQTFQPIQWFLSYRQKHDAMRSIPTDDDDVDWLLGGAKAEHTNWRVRNYLKARHKAHVGIA